MSEEKIELTAEEIKKQKIEQAKKNKESSLRRWIEDKISLSEDWIENQETQKSRQILRAGVYKCELGENVGTEQGERRPVLVVSNELINTTSGNVSVIPLTKVLKTKTVKGKIVPRYQSHYFLKKGKYNFLEFDSAVLAEEVKTVSKVRLIEHMGDLDPEDFKRILKRVSWVLGI